MAFPTSEVRMTVEHVGDITVVRLQETKILDEESVASMGRKLMDLVEKENVRKMILNFEGVSALSSAALGKLLALYARLVTELKGQLVLCSIVTHINEVFVITRLDRKFTIVKDEQEALKRF